ncbi:MAG: DNA translocase FtsK, partial [Planctomycetes bacterium]|nr:DNA translocase FtsK [Planctomycetota bacterium]
SDGEVERLVYFWSNQHRPGVASLKVEEIALPPATGGKGTPSEDPLLTAARQLAAEHQTISASFLQRRLRIGYPRAARIMEELEAEGIKGEEEKPEG